MDKSSWVASNALLLSLVLGTAGVFNSSTAWAQEGPGSGLPTVEDPPKEGGEPAVEGPGKDDEGDKAGGAEPAKSDVQMPPDCFLTGRHFNFLQAEIDRLEAEEANLQRQIAALQAGSPQLVEQIRLLNQRLVEVTAQLTDAYFASRPWSGWHLRVGALVQGTAFSGADNYAVPLQLDVSGEWIDARTHLGWRGGGAIGMWFTEGETSGKMLAPLMVTGYMSAVASWEYWSVLLPQVRANFLQSSVDDKPGMLWVTINGGGEYHIEGAFFMDVLVGTSVYSTLQRLGGLHVLGMLGWYY